MSAIWPLTHVLCRINPTGELYFDGTTLGPYDVLFVKLKRLMLEGHTPGTSDALRHQAWMSAIVRLAALTAIQLCTVWLLLLFTKTGSAQANCLQLFFLIIHCSLEHA